MSAPEMQHDGFGPVVPTTLSRIQQIAGSRLHAAWTTIPHVTHHESADVTAIDELAARGRTGTLRPTELEGSCFTISSLGALGGTGFTPIVNPPNVAILGASQARWQPACVDGAIVPRFLLPLSLSYDHRVIDGADAARFCTSVRDALAEPERLAH